MSSVKTRLLNKLRIAMPGIFADQSVRLWSMREAILDLNVASIKAHIAARYPDALVLHGYKVYSQCDEDGIIARLFELLGERSRLFVEIGCGNGLENNTHNLLLKGWRGVWIDADSRNISHIRSELNYKRNTILAVIEGFASAENINGLVEAGLRDIGMSTSPTEVDFCSIDIDGMELYVWKALKVIRPRVICIEYNARFPPPMEVLIDYRADHLYAGDDYQGASLQSLASALHDRGYILAACNISGVNAFFVRRDEAEKLKLPDVASIYMPPRHYMTTSQPGLRSSMKHARSRLEKAVMK